MYFRLCVLFCWFFSFARAQTTIEFIPTFQHKTVTFNQVFSDSIQLHAFSFYVGQIELLHKDKVVKRYDTYHLLTLNDSSKTTITLNQCNKQAVNAIRMLIGVDSATVENGVLAGDLDPMNGHFWTWQSGYIHLKMEGEIIRNQSEKKSFAYHIGGATAPTNTLQTVTFPFVKRGNKLVVELTIDPLLNWIAATNDYEIMSPSPAAVAFSGLFQQLFKPIMP
jgi:hypothetical protein